MTTNLDALTVAVGTLVGHSRRMVDERVFATHPGEAAMMLTANADLMDTLFQTLMRAAHDPHWFSEWMLSEVAAKKEPPPLPPGRPQFRIVE